MSKDTSKKTSRPIMVRELTDKELELKDAFSGFGKNYDKDPNPHQVCPSAGLDGVWRF